MATILVVDDRPTNRQLLVTLLGYRGHCLLEAGDGEEALRVTRAEKPDLIISDILMPTMDGFEFVRRLRADPLIAGIKVIFYTAHYHQREAQALAQSCGVTHVLSKPAEPDVILRIVDGALSASPAASAAGAPSENFDATH